MITNKRVLILVNQGLGVAKHVVKGGFWNVDDVLRPIYEDASEKFGREFPYPGDETSSPKDNQKSSD